MSFLGANVNETNSSLARFEFGNFPGADEIPQNARRLFFQCPDHQPIRQWDG